LNHCHSLGQAFEYAFGPGWVAPLWIWNRVRGKGDYLVYGRTLAEMLQPTAKDKRVARLLGGPLAKELFDQIGTDWKGSYGDAPG
jgi:hypothetical protein